MLILGIETSCDDTAVAVIKANHKEIKTLSSLVSSQITLHEKWGGVVPNLAAREHLSNIVPVIGTAIKQAKIKLIDLDLIAVTNGPGLIPCLLIGTSAAKTLAYFYNKPLLGIHHIEGHIYANYLNRPKPIKFPALCLVVSGGNTQLILMKNHFDYKIIGQTLDDAAGEAFDKVARILNLGYPGGPRIAAMAKKGKINCAINLPRPMLNSPDLNFSFSGLKTAVLYLVKKSRQKMMQPGFVQSLCYDFQQAIIEVLIAKTIKAAQKYRPKTIMLAGGVSANRKLRNELGKKIEKEFRNVVYMIPDTNYSIDNAAMTATAAFYRWQKMSKKERKNSIDNWKIIDTDPNLKLK